MIWLVTWLAQTLIRRRTRSQAVPGRRARGGGKGGPTRGQRALAWTPYSIGLPVFLVALYVFFENFGRLLPGNY